MKGKRKKPDGIRWEKLPGLNRKIPGLLCSCAVLSVLYASPVFAAADMWGKAKEIMQDVYIVTASAALLLMNFSRSGRTVDESRAWLKRICITWVILNSLGFIMAYVAPFFEGGQWNG